jgi:hypothetical protein
MAADTLPPSFRNVAPIRIQTPLYAFLTCQVLPLHHVSAVREALQKLLPSLSKPALCVLLLRVCGWSMEPLPQITHSKDEVALALTFGSSSSDGGMCSNGVDTMCGVDGEGAGEGGADKVCLSPSLVALLVLRGACACARFSPLVPATRAAVPLVSATFTAPSVMFPVSRQL